MVLTNDFWEAFVAQGVSRLTACRVAPVDEFPDHTRWLSEFARNGMIRLGLPSQTTGLCYSLIRRADAAIEDYEAARTALNEFVSQERSVGAYFGALRKFESTVASVYQFLTFAMRVPGWPRPFVQGDGSAAERLNLAYNSFRHTDPTALPAGHIHAVWMEDDGLHVVGGATLTFDELRQCVAEVGRMARSLANFDPAAFQAQQAQQAAP